MRKLLSTLSICVVLLIFLLTACQNNTGKEKSTDSTETSKKKPTQPLDSVKRTPAEYARRCSDEYQKIYNPNNPDNVAITKSYTESVSFDGKTLMSYIAGVDSAAFKDFYIVFGIYVDPVSYNLGAPADQQVDPKDYIGKVGRLTVFIWPFKKDGKGHGHGGHGGHGGLHDPNDSEPLNMGDLHP